MSARPSTSAPLSASGAIYASVPEMRPGAKIIVLNGRLRRVHLCLPLGEAEVEHLEPALRRHDHVGALEIAVHDAARVGMRERIGDLRPIVGDGLGGESARRNRRRERPTSTNSMTRYVMSPDSPTS